MKQQGRRRPSAASGAFTCHLRGFGSSDHATISIYRPPPRGRRRGYNWASTGDTGDVRFADVTVIYSGKPPWSPVREVVFGGQVRICANHFQYVQTPTPPRHDHSHASSPRSSEVTVLYVLVSLHDPDLPP